MADADGAGPAPVVVVDLEEDAPAAVAPAAAQPEGDVVDLSGGDEAFAGLPKHAVTLPDGRVHLPLARPVVLRIKRGEAVREETFDALTLRRLTGADMRAIAAAGKDAAFVALQRSSDIPALKFERLFDRMDGADVAAATEVVGFFLQPGRTTGR